LIEQYGEGVVEHVAGMQQELEALRATVASLRAHVELLCQRLSATQDELATALEAVTVLTGEAGDTCELLRAALEEVETLQAKYVLPLFFEFFTTFYKGGLFYCFATPLTFFLMFSFSIDRFLLIQGQSEARHDARKGCARSVRARFRATRRGLCP
jgi:hypothetical protein